MSHFAEIDENNIVLRVIVAEQDFIDSGAVGDPKKWIQTSYNTRGGVHYITSSSTPSADQSKALRKNYACVDYLYDPVLDAFIPPKPFLSWTLNKDTCYWDPPIPCPEGDVLYVWDEPSLQWILCPCNQCLPDGATPVEIIP